uniref:CCHC-type domain-containing protein n=1 Tax=Tanacetum cinerariifolium TaxID=118510 RepID=A0A6L2KFT6_TANCI|nr:hypothetical protein [Tanacetum cinerariifolium]
MSTLAEFMIVADDDNRPPMLDKPQYESWKSRMELYVQGKGHRWIIVNLVENGPLVWPTVEQEDDTVRLTPYEELSDKEKIQADCDLKATKILNPYGARYHSQQYPTIYLTNLSHTPPSVPKNTYSPLIIPQQPQAEFPQTDAGLGVPTFLSGDDPIACMNKAMAFLSAVFSPRYPSTNNQLRSSTNSRNQATVQDGSQGNTLGQAKVIKCYNCQEEGHMARQCTQPKRKKDATWFKEKVMLVQAHAKGKELDEDQLAFLADPGVVDAKAVLLASLSSCDLDILSELQAKNTIISKLNETIHSLRENANLANVKQDIDKIETINIELEHSVAKLLSENVKSPNRKELLKKTYKELKLKGKTVIDTVVSKPHATTIAPGMFKLDFEPLVLKVLKNKDAHPHYIKHSREHADTLLEIVKSARALSRLDSNLDSAYKYIQRIQEVLVYVRDTCPCLTRPSEKLVDVTLKNKDRRLRFADIIMSSSNT